MPTNPPSRTALNKLTDLRIRTFIANAKRSGRGICKISDGGSLLLVVKANGTALWHFKYTVAGKPRIYSLGVYPLVSLAVAREERTRLRAQVAEGIDPVAARLVRRATAAVDASNTFARAYGAWLEKKSSEWSGIHRKTSDRAFERDVLPRLGRLPVGGISSALVLKVIKGIADRGAVETALKVLQHCNGVFRMAQAMGWCQSNPAEPVREALPKRKRSKAMPAILDFVGLGGVLRDAEMARLSPAVRMAHRLAAFTTARMGNVTLAEWGEFDLESAPAVWTIPRAKMKAQDRPHDHKIILCPQIVDELKVWRNYTGDQGYLFPTPTRSGNARPISREAVEKAYRQTLEPKDRHTPHGWRAAFSTLAKDSGFSRDAVELALDHVHDNEVVRAYDRGERLEERVQLMCWWGDKLSGAQRGGEIVKFPGSKAA